MKKIFAFILASIMVLSLVPASAFAAITKDEPCPDVHTVANCVERVVRHVAATCRQNGYTIFACTVCETQFVGNVITAGDHVWESDPDASDYDVEPDCTKEPYEYVTEDQETILAIGQLNKICTECGQTHCFPVTLADYHAEVGEWVSGVGCEAVYECPVCEETFNAEGGAVGEHEDWDLIEVITEPTATTEGLARFGCTAEGCKATKTVTIKPQCPCKNYYGNDQVKFYNAYVAGKLESVTAPVKPTCTTDGKYAIYKCVDCGLFYRWKTKDAKKSTDLPVATTDEDGIVTGISNGSFGWVEKNENKTSSYKINKLGHNVDMEKLKKIDDCHYTIYCKTCKQTLSCDAKGDTTKDAHDWYKKSEKEATCLEYGIKYEVCKVCGQDNNTVTPPSDHKEATYTYASTCGKYGYTITYCANNDKCSIAAPTEERYYDATTGKVYADIRVKIDNKKEYRPVLHVEPLTTLKGSHTFTTTTIIGDTGACDSVLLVMNQCKDCNYTTYEQIAGNGHDYKEAVTVPATCTTPGTITKECKVCGYDDVVVLPALKDHEYVVTEIYYECTKDSGVNDSNRNSFFGGPGYSPDNRYYRGIKFEACKHGCVGTERKTYIDPVDGPATKTWFETKEEAQLYHGGHAVYVNGVAYYTNDNTLERLSYKEPTCINAGYEILYCNKCTATVYVTYAEKAHEPTKNADGSVWQSAGQAPTCTASGVASYSLCQTCNQKIVKNSKGVYVIASAADLVLNPHTQKAPKVHEIKSCDGKTVKYYECTAEDCGKLFADEKCTKPVDKLPENNIHTGWTTIHAGSVLNCNVDGYPEIRYCTVCKTLEKTQYVMVYDAETNTVSKEVLESKSESWPNVEEYAISTKINFKNGSYDKSAYKINKIGHGVDKDCPEDYRNTLMNDKAYSSTANCDDEYGYIGHVCNLCGHEFITDFVTAAGGHVNTYGEVLEESCANFVAVKDRHCVNCDKDIGMDKDLHDYVDMEPIDATCVSEGYTLSYCKNEGCTWFEVTKPTAVIDAKEYHKDINHLESTDPQDYAHNGDEIWTCKACGEVVKVETAKDYNLPAGFEIYPSIEYSKYAVGSYIDVVIALDSLKGVDVWAFNFAVQYTAASVEYVGCKTTSETGFNAVAHKETMIVEDVLDADGDNNTTEKIEIATGNINILVDSKAGVEIKGEQELMVLTFKVVSELKAANPYLPAPESINFMVYAAEAVAPNGKTVDVNALGANVTKQFKVTEIFDLNKDGKTTIADAYELYALIELGGYNVLGDVNGNGINDAFDLNELYLYIIGAKTADEILFPEAEVEYAPDYQDGYDVNGNPYFPYWDMNDNGIMDAGEIRQMTRPLPDGSNQ